jgi:hypothetical protein
LLPPAALDGVVLEAPAVELSLAVELPLEVALPLELALALAPAPAVVALAPELLLEPPHAATAIANTAALKVAVRSLGMLVKLLSIVWPGTASPHCPPVAQDARHSGFLPDVIGSLPLRYGEARP